MNKEMLFSIKPSGFVFLETSVYMDAYYSQQMLKQNSCFIQTGVGYNLGLFYFDTNVNELSRSSTCLPPRRPGQRPGLCDRGPPVWSA